MSETSIKPAGDPAFVTTHVTVIVPRKSILPMAACK